MSKASIIYKLEQETNPKFTPKERRYIIKKLLAEERKPPTSQEVCEALSEWYKKKVEYNIEDKRFHNFYCYDVAVLIAQRVAIKDNPQIYLILSRFYKAQNKEERENENE